MIPNLRCISSPDWKPVGGIFHLGTTFDAAHIPSWTSANRKGANRSLFPCSLCTHWLSLPHSALWLLSTLHLQFSKPELRGVSKEINSDRGIIHMACWRNTQSLRGKKEIFPILSLWFQSMGWQGKEEKRAGLRHMASITKSTKTMLLYFAFFFLFSISYSMPDRIVYYFKGPFLKVIS